METHFAIPALVGLAPSTPTSFYTTRPKTGPAGRSKTRDKCAADGRLAGRCLPSPAQSAQLAQSVAIVIINDPYADQPRIGQCVAQGRRVRPRADARAREVRSGELSRLDAAQPSGAHVISVDYHGGEWEACDFDIGLVAGTAAGLAAGDAQAFGEAFPLADAAAY